MNNNYSSTDLQHIDVMSADMNKELTIDNDNNKGVTAEEEWTLVGNRKRRSPRQSVRPGPPLGRVRGGGGSRLTGARKVGITSMKAVRPTADIFLGRVDKSVDKDVIVEYIKENFSIIVQNIENIRIHSEFYNAFKITVFSDEREKLFNAELWPEGLIVNKFYKRRKE